MRFAVCCDVVISLCSQLSWYTPCFWAEILAFGVLTQIVPPSACIFPQGLSCTGTLFLIPTTPTTDSPCESPITYHSIHQQQYGNSPCVGLNMSLNLKKWPVKCPESLLYVLMEVELPPDTVFKAAVDPLHLTQSLFPSLELLSCQG